MHLSGIVVADNLERHFLQTPKNLLDTALHTSKDFAVALSCRHEITLQESPSLSASASLFAPRGLLQTGVTCYLSQLNE